MLTKYVVPPARFRAKTSCVDPLASSGCRLDASLLNATTLPLPLIRGKCEFALPPPFPSLSMLTRYVVFVFKLAQRSLAAHCYRTRGGCARRWAKATMLPSSLMTG